MRIDWPNSSSNWNLTFFYYYYILSQVIGGFIQISNLKIIYFVFFFFTLMKDIVEKTTRNKLVGKRVLVNEVNNHTAKLRKTKNPSSPSILCLAN